MGKKKNKQRARRQASHSSDPFLDFDEDDYEGYGYDEELNPVDGARFGEDEPRFQFDFERWREDVTARSSHREEMRQRDLRRGILSSTRVRRLPLDEEIEDDDL